MVATADSVILRFSLRTPFWPLTMSYGLFHDPSIRRNFCAIDQYIGYMMFREPLDREAVAAAPNGYIAYNTMQTILTNGHLADPRVDNWDHICDDIMLQGLRLKFKQSSMLAEMLIKTYGRPIIDESRASDTYWCNADDTGLNKHGLHLETVRAELAADYQHLVPSKSSLRA